MSSASNTFIFDDLRLRGKTSDPDKTFRRWMDLMLLDPGSDYSIMIGRRHFAGGLRKTRQTRFHAV